MECLSIELEGRAWKCPGTNKKSIVDGTVLYCTVQLYCTSIMPWSSQFYYYNIERILMTGMESQIFTAQRLHGTHLTPRHIITRGDITHRSGPGQIENDVDSSDFHGFEQLEKFGRVWSSLVDSFNFHVGNSLNSSEYEWESDRDMCPNPKNRWKVNPLIQTLIP